MAITINKDRIKMGQRGGKTTLTVTYSRPTRNEPNILYFIMSNEKGNARSNARYVGEIATEERVLDDVIKDKFEYFEDKVIEFDHKIALDKWELVETIDIDDPSVDIGGGIVTPGEGEIAVPVAPSGWAAIRQTEELDSRITYEVTVNPYVNANNSPISRMAVIMFSDDVTAKGIAVTQHSGYMTIWQNYPYIKDSGIETKYEYTLINGLKTIYKGISVALNDWSHPLPINIPRLCESTLETNRFYINEGWEDLGGTSVIDMYHGDELVETFYFCNDWSSKRLMYNRNTIINDPINGHLAPGMYVPLCIYNANDSEDWYVISDYGGGNVQEDLMGMPTYNFDSYTVTVPAGLQEMIFYNAVETGVRLEYDATHCGPGYFIYRNRYGAWDVFLIEGNIYENEDYTRDSHSKNNMDNTRDTWVKVTNRISISKNYTASTGWLTDEQAEKLVYHLMGSPEVYYQPFGGNMVAVNLTDNQAEIKKFRNGRRLIQYNINFEESKTRRVNR